MSFPFPRLPRAPRPWLVLGVMAAALISCADDEPLEPVVGEYEDEQTEEGWLDGNEAYGTFDKALETVGQLVSARTCSTGLTAPLNIQVAQEMACISPSKFEPITGIANVELGAGANPFLQAGAAQALRRVAASNPGATFTVNSSWRSTAQQYILKRWEGSCGIGVAASPGRSNHESGLAVDVSSGTTNAFAGALRREGFVWYCDRTNRGRAAGCRDTPHWEYSRGENLSALSIKAFQRLWNRANPSDRISEDGVYGNNTASRLARAPLSGFSTGTSCGTASQPEPETPPVSGEERTVEELTNEARGLRVSSSTKVWRTTLSARTCDVASINEDFSSGRYNLHRWATTVSPDGAVSVRLERTAGTWDPAIFVFDTRGEVIYAGDAETGHSVVGAEVVQSGRSGGVAEVKLTASAFQQVFVYVTSWGAVDAGLGAGVPTSARYTLRHSQSCGGGATTGTLAEFYAGLTLDGMEVPRSGLSNPTLNQVHGVQTERHGATATQDGLSFVKGKVSWFGGPNDTGVSASETGAVTFETLRSLNSPVNASAEVIQSRPRDFYYVAMRWNYSPLGREWWANARLLVVNPSNGRAVVVRPVDWGPGISTGRILDLSPQSLTDLGLSTDQEALVSFAPAGAPLGRVR